MLKAICAKTTHKKCQPQQAFASSGLRNVYSESLRHRIRMINHVHLYDNVVFKEM